MKNDRLSKLKKNTVASLSNQAITLICGFVLPKFILLFYGSTVNGLVSSISQFLAFFSLMEMGVGAVVRSELYKALANKDGESVNKILVSSKRFFGKIGGILVIYSIVLMVYFPLYIDRSLGIFSTVLLVFSMAISGIYQYLFGISYQLLLTADQVGHIQYNISSVCVILNTAISIVLIILDAPIVAVKLVSSFVLLIRPIALRIHVKRNYKLDLSQKLPEEPLHNKWSGFSQHIATYITKNTDTIVLTVFSTLSNVSIYHVYNLVANGLHMVFESFSTSFGPLLGDMYAKKETKKLNDLFSKYEYIIHSLSSFVFSCTSVLLIPFVQVYTKDINDALYVQPIFAQLLVVATVFFCIRIPYRSMVYAAGHFKETQLSSLIEASINIMVSIILVGRYGLIGVAIGTLCAMTIQTIYLAFYLKKHILQRPFHHFVKHLIVDAVIILVVTIVGHGIHISALTYFAWFILALKVAGIAFLTTAVVNLLTFRSESLALVKSIRLFQKRIQ